MSSHERRSRSRGRTWFQALGRRRTARRRPVSGACSSPTRPRAASGCGFSRSCPIRGIAFPAPGTASSGSRRAGRSPATCGKRSPPMHSGDEAADRRDRRCPEPGLWAPRGTARHPPVARRGRRRLCEARMAGHPVVALIVGTGVLGGPPRARLSGPSPARARCSRSRRPRDGQGKRRRGSRGGPSKSSTSSARPSCRWRTTSGSSPSSACCTS